MIKKCMGQHDTFYFAPRVVNYSNYIKCIGIKKSKNEKMRSAVTHSPMSILNDAHFRRLAQDASTSLRKAEHHQKSSRTGIP
jgi:hypothetical protein